MKKLQLSRLAIFVLAFIATSLAAFGQVNHLVISQVYGGGGNSGSTYTNDFIELYNPTNAAISTSGLSIQYTSKAGLFTSASNVASLTAVTIGPGQYYLIQGAKGTGGTTALPTPDLTTTLTLSATDGKVALVNGTTALGTNGCPLPNATIVDFVGFGGADCSEGGAPTPVLTNTTAAIRKSLTVDTDNNLADFTTGPPNPHNSTSGVPTGALSATGTANPAAVNAGQPATLTVTVTPATLPASTGITVIGDLRLIGGIQSQPFTDSGDGINFSFTANAVSSTDGAVILPISIADSESHTATTSITLTVNQPTPTVTIPEIQGRKSLTAATVSPYAGQKVTTTGIITTVLSNGFFIQSQVPDGDPLTPEGVEVFTSTAPPASVAIGNIVTVTGTVATFPDITLTHTPATEITSPTIVPGSVGNQLPAPIVLTPAMLTASGGLYQLTPYEGMRVTMSSLTAISGTNGSVTDANEDAELATSTGYFYGVIGNTPRPFREPGIDIRDPYTPLPPNVAHFDDNPERILVDSTIAGAASLEISTGTVLPNATGVLDFTFSKDSFFDPSRLILDAAYDRTQIVPGMTPQPAAPAAAKEFTVASFNIERFYNTNAADNTYFIPSSNKTGTSEAATLTQPAYTRRLQKLSLAVRTILNTPDIVTLEEVENQSVANDIANQINTDAGIPNLYTALSTDNSTYFTQDGTGISVGFLVKNSTVDQLGFTQFGQGETFTPSTSSSPITLNDRPWLVLSAGIKRAGASDYPVTVIVNHMKALTGVDSTTSTSTREKKELQAEDIAKYIQTLQASGKHVISGGDFNAFEFSDGYTDTLATYTNTNVLSADQVVKPGVAGLVTPPLTDMALLLQPTERWSYVEDGSAQILDHMAITPDLVAAGAHMAYVHLNADFPVTAYNDATTPARSSDHDPVIGYFTIPAPVASATLTPASADFGSSNTVGIASTGHVFTLTNTGEIPVGITSVTATGDYAATNSCGSTLTLSAATCAINVVLTPTVAGTRTGSLTVVTNAGTYTSILTGVATATAPPATFSIGDSTGNTTTAGTVDAGSSLSVPLTFTSLSGSTSITLTCTGPASAPGITCSVPAPFTLSGSAVTQTITLKTTSRTTSSGFALSFGSGSLWTAIAGFGISGLLMLLTTRSRRIGNSVLRAAGLLMLVFAVSFTAVGCSSTKSNGNPAGTPAGTYTYTITATPTSGTAHTETINLTVQ